MTSNTRFLDGHWVPADSRITYQDFKHWEQAMRQSHEMSQTQADGQHLRKLSMCGPDSPSFTPQVNANSESQVPFDAADTEHIVLRLARNRPAIDALRRTSKMRYRRNLKLLASSFPLADELAVKNKEAKKSQGLTDTEILAQKELAKRKAVELTVEELKCIKEMKAAKSKAAAEERLRQKNERASNIDGVGKKTEKTTGKGIQKASGSGMMKPVEKRVEKTAAKVTGNRVDKSAYVGTAKNAGKVVEITTRKTPDKTSGKDADKSASKSTEKMTPKTSTEKAAPKKTGGTPAKRSGKMSLRAKMMPKMKRW